MTAKKSADRHVLGLLVLLLAAPSVYGEEPFELGPRESLVVATWNVEWLFDDNQNDNASDLAKEMSAKNRAVYDLRLRGMADVVAAVKPTVLALQEIESDKVAQDLADALRVHHKLEYKVGFVQGTDSFTEQDVAFLVDQRLAGFSVGRIDARGEGLDDRDRYKIPSKHAALSFQMKVKGEPVSVCIITAHLKAGSDDRDEQQRILQARAINKFAARLQQEGGEVILLGDLNAGQPYRSTSPRDAMGVLTGLETADKSDDFIDLHRSLSTNWRGTHVSGRELDRIVVDPDLLDGAGLDAGRIFNHRPAVPPGLSDHAPLSVRLNVKP